MGGGRGLPWWSWVGNDMSMCTVLCCTVLYLLDGREAQDLAHLHCHQQSLP